MSKYPKYSERSNFFFVINGKEIPLKKHFNLIEKLQSKISNHRKMNSSLLDALSESATLERDSNKYIQQETRPKDVSDLEIIFTKFFICAEEIVQESSNSKIHTQEALISLLLSTVSIVNSYIQKMDNTWLLKYGSVSSEYLEYKSPLDFLIEILPITSEIFGKRFKSTVKKLKQYRVNRHTILLKSCMSKSINF